MRLKLKGVTLDKTLPWIMVVGGLIGLIFAAILVYDHEQILKNPNYIPSCNLNPIIACGDVISSKQAQAFGVSNPLIGLVGWPIIITSGVVLLMGAKLKRWYWLGLEFGALFAVGFMHWLFFETVYRIHALCPYCMGTWVVAITLFWYLTLYNIRVKNIVLPKRLKPFGQFIQRHHFDILVLWLLILASLILKHFWYYYGKHFF